MLQQLLLIKELKGFGPVKINKEYLPKLKTFETVDALCSHISRVEAKLTDKDIDDAKNKAEEIYGDIIKNPLIHMISPLDEEYPEGLKNLGNKKPVLLFVKGNIGALKKSGIAVVGTREPSSRTVSAGPNIITKLLNIADFSIISGLALGCDAIAHKAALDYNACTIAVLPSGVDSIYPSVHKKLAESIVESGGCLISEYVPDEKPQKSTFVRRDELIAAISRGTLALECGVKSGTMHTIDFAIELDRPVACFLPDDAGTSFDGCRMVINNSKGIRITTPIDLHKFVSCVLNENDRGYEQVSFFDEKEKYV